MVNIYLKNKTERNSFSFFIDDAKFAGRDASLHELTSGSEAATTEGDRSCCDGGGEELRWWRRLKAESLQMTGDGDDRDDNDDGWCSEYQLWCSLLVCVSWRRAFA